MRRKFILGVLVLLFFPLLSGCSPSQPSLTPTSTQEPAATYTTVPTPTNTPEPTATISPIPTSTLTITPKPIHPVGKVVLHDTDEFNPYYWFSYVPHSINKDEPVYIFITGIRAETYDTYENLVDVARGEIERKIKSAEDYGLVILVPHIPRQDQPHIYTAAFSRIVFSTNNAFFSRPDEKIISMIDDLSIDLASDGYEIQNKVFLEGHSIGGLFAIRFSLLHPERVQAIAAQCGGDFTLPVSQYEDLILPWPIGIGDFFSLTGYEFNEQAYNEIPQFIYTGENDIGPENPLIIDYETGQNSALWDMGWDQTTAKYWIQFVVNNFGSSFPEQTENQVSFLNEVGFSKIIFKLYPNVGHVQTNEMLRDSLDFLSSKKD